MVAGVAVLALSAWVGVAAVSGPKPSRTATAGAAGNGFPTTGGPGGYSGRGTAGTIQSVHGPDLILLDRQGATVPVTTSSQTVFLKTVVGALRDVKRGDTIVASGVFSASGEALTAGRIAVLRSRGRTPGGPASPGARTLAPNQPAVATGTVAAMAADTWTIDMTDGTSLAVLVGSSTAVTTTTTGSLADLKAGDTVMVRGTVNDDGSVDASQIQQGGGSAVFGGGQFGGFGRPAGSPPDASAATTGFGFGVRAQP